MQGRLWLYRNLSLSDLPLSTRSRLGLLQAGESDRVIPLVPERSHSSHPQTDQHRNTSVRSRSERILCLFVVLLRSRFRAMSDAAQGNFRSLFPPN